MRGLHQQRATQHNDHYTKHRVTFAHSHLFVVCLAYLLIVCCVLVWHYKFLIRLISDLFQFLWFNLSATCCRE